MVLKFLRSMTEKSVGQREGGWGETRKRGSRGSQMRRIREGGGAEGHRWGKTGKRVGQRIRVQSEKGKRLGKE